VIIGAGPAGLTAALEMVRHGGIKPIVLEASHEIGGISRTIQYKGNRMDIGGHRFFSKSDRVMEWWLEIMPPALAEGSAPSFAIKYQNKKREVDTSGAGVALDPQKDDLLMLVRPRKSRIYFLRRFFDYPIKLTPDTLRKLGMWRTMRVGMSYLRARFFQRKPEKSLEDFIVNRFGKELYGLFFESYTEKVWGVHPRHISPEWGAQRIKGLSLTSAAMHFLKQIFGPKKKRDLAQKGTETSLIEQFLYPKLAPGSLWEHVAELVEAGGGEVHLGMQVRKLLTEGDRIGPWRRRDDDGQNRIASADQVISTMPVRHLINALDCPVPQEVKDVSNGLMYRDFITVGTAGEQSSVTEDDGSAAERHMDLHPGAGRAGGPLADIQQLEPVDGRRSHEDWIGLEYFCNDTDELWKMPDEELKKFAAAEVEKIGILNVADVIDAHVVRVPKTYPAYFGTYDRFDTLREFTDKFENLYMVGRNGMHKYNNQDHSMLTAMEAVENIAKGIRDQRTIFGASTPSRSTTKRSRASESAGQRVSESASQRVSRCWMLIAHRDHSIRSKEIPKTQDRQIAKRWFC
jgi:protoporphyrinogen oxidase